MILCESVSISVKIWRAFKIDGYDSQIVMSGFEYVLVSVLPWTICLPIH